MVLLLELSRGLAALWVFFFHVKPLFEISSPVIFQLSAYGSLGVPMFFVISGYVITCSAESSLKNNKSPFVFLKSRFLRIYPAFWASVVVVLITPYLIEAISSFKSGEFITPENIFSKFNYIEWTNFLLLSKVFWATSGDLQAEFNTVNSVYWTLAIEFQFYIIVFISLFFGKYYRYVIACISLIALLIMLKPSGLNQGLFIHYWPHFSVGIALAYIHRNGFWFRHCIKSNLKLLLTFFVVTVLLLATPTEFYKDRLFFAICFGVLLWVISDVEQILMKLKNSDNKFLFWILEPWLILGAMSYSVYLLHGKINQVPSMFARQVMDSNSILFAFFVITGTLILCYPFYYFIERKFLSKNYKVIHQKIFKD